MESPEYRVTHASHLQLLRLITIHFQVPVAPMARLPHIQCVGSHAPHGNAVVFPGGLGRFRRASHVSEFSDSMPPPLAHPKIRLESRSSAVRMLKAMMKSCLGNHRPLGDLRSIVRSQTARDILYRTMSAVCRCRVMRFASRDRSSKSDPSSTYYDLGRNNSTSVAGSAQD